MQDPAWRHARGLQGSRERFPDMRAVERRRLIEDPSIAIGCVSRLTIAAQARTVRLPSR